MILLIDNYDSFSYNIYQLIGEFRKDLCVARNDAVTIQEMQTMNPDAIILSPGPGKPAEAGICEEVIRHFLDRKPILGICLGHQAICEALGGTISYASAMMHGKQSVTAVDSTCSLFRGLPDQILVGRYHSLSLREETLPDELQITARADDGEIMAVAHRNYPIYGVQFHPESVLTPQGRSIMKNFLEGI